MTGARCKLAGKSMVLVVVVFCCSFGGSSFGLVWFFGLFVALVWFFK